MPRPLIPAGTTPQPVSAFRVVGEAAAALKRISAETRITQQQLLENWILRCAEEYDEQKLDKVKP